MIANEKDFLTNALAYKLNLRGPALNIQTACSTSLVTVCVACQNLLDHQCDVALAGGVSLTFPQERGYFYPGRQHDLARRLRAGPSMRGRMAPSSPAAPAWWC